MRGGGRRSVIRTMNRPSVCIVRLFLLRPAIRDVRFELAWTFAPGSGPSLLYVRRPGGATPLITCRFRRLFQAYSRSALGEQFRQLGKNGGDTLCLVAREQLAAVSPTRLLFEIHVSKGLPIQVFHHKTAVQFLDGPGRREVALRLRHDSFDHSPPRQWIKYRVRSCPPSAHSGENTHRAADAHYH